MFAKIVALVAHEVYERFAAPVIAEYRNIDLPPVCGLPHVAERGYDVASTTGANIERAPTWDHDKRPPAVAGFGFTRPGR